MDGFQRDVDEVGVLYNVLGRYLWASLRTELLSPSAQLAASHGSIATDPREASFNCRLHDLSTLVQRAGCKGFKLVRPDS